MPTKADYKDFQARLNAYDPSRSVTEEQAIAGLHNLLGFIELLIEINKETKVVPIEKTSK